MCLLFESIKILNGVPLNIRWHENRIRRSLDEISLPYDKDIPLNIPIPDEFKQGIVKCRYTFGKVSGKISFEFYKKKSIRTLKLVTSDTIDYHLKFCDRRLLDSLYEKRNGCDDILIVKNGFITDTSISNVVFFDDNKWYTPARPLLKGTCRERLLENGLISEMEIHQNDLRSFRYCKLINAMRDFDDGENIPIDRII